MSNQHQHLQLIVIATTTMMLLLIVVASLHLLTAIAVEGFMLGILAILHILLMK